MSAIAPLSPLPSVSSSILLHLSLSFSPSPPLLSLLVCFPHPVPLRSVLRCPGSALLPLPLPAFASGLRLLAALFWFCRPPTGFVGRLLPSLTWCVPSNLALVGCVQGSAEGDWGGWASCVVDGSHAV
ncbi:unnamed protein product [Mycena citricolor]|uniref:Uncharacterized protein n=1 Tax=Mycena citricolor TaxID=2018698 RepID=A0AAD2H298_9AGAR|nr:unnamed protein product [Mycena citricolor]